jgi:hypothetical protein
MIHVDKKLNNLKVDNPSLGEAADFLEDLEKKKDSGPEEGIIAQRARIPGERLEAAMSFWKQIYLSYSVEGRLLNGIEAFDLGDEKRHHSQADKAPYIAMCNLMALEAILRMGDTWPTVEDPAKMAGGTERERDIADFWKKTFGPTLFQARWAWSAAMAVMAGEPSATQELLYQYKSQLP